MTVGVRMETIREALFDDEALGALPSWLARAAGARSAIIVWRHLDGVHEIIAFNQRSAGFAALYAYKYAALDPWVRAARAASRQGELLRFDGRVPAGALERSRFYREFIGPEGDETVHAAVAVFDAPSGQAIVCLHRGRSEAPFGPSDTEPLDALLPHLGRVLRARGEGVARRRRELVVRDGLDDLALGAIVVGCDGRIARVNLAADQVLRRADGLRVKAGALSGVDQGARLRLQAAIALATAPDNPIATAIPVERVLPGSSPAEGSDRLLAYMVSVTPMRGEGDGSLAMLVFRDPDGPDDSLAGRLRALFRPARTDTGASVACPGGAPLRARPQARMIEV